MRVLTDKTIDGLLVNQDRAKALAESSPAIVTPLTKVIGYEAAAKIAKHAVTKDVTVKQAALDLGYVDGDTLSLKQLDQLLAVLPMTRPWL